MHAFVLQNWLTLSGSSSVTSITQGEESWLDLSPFQDVVFHVQCSERAGGGTARVLFQTAPAKDESLFKTMALTTLVGGTTSVVPAPMFTAAVPLARYVRWIVTGPSTGWDATFRVLVTANAPGM